MGRLVVPALAFGGGSGGQKDTALVPGTFPGGSQQQSFCSVVSSILSITVRAVL